MLVTPQRSLQLSTSSVGPGFKQAMLPGYPANPESPILESDYAGRELREITFDGPDSFQIGQFPAFDYFGDGSFYLLDSPGHAVGHICVARTTKSPDTFALLGGDVCFYARAFRPSKYMPVPETIDPHPCSTHSDKTFGAGAAFEQLQEARGRSATDALFDITFGENIPLAKESIEHLRELDCNEDIFTIVSHDSDVRDGVLHFPDSLNAWKENGWGKGLRWNFFSDLEKYLESNGLV